MLDKTVPGKGMPVPTIDLQIPGAKAVKPTRLQFAGSDGSLFPGVTRRTARIIEGCICLVRPLADGRRQILDVLGPGRLVGPYLADLTQCSATALALTRLEALDPKAESAEIAAAARLMLLRSQSHALLLGRKTLAERVATALLDLASQFSRGSPAKGDLTFHLYLTRAELADWLGLTLESVSRCLNTFKRDGLIVFDRPKVITILDREALEALASGAPALKHLRN